MGKENARKSRRPSRGAGGLTVPARLVALRPESKKAAQTRRTRARILETAEALFCEHGYGATSIEAVVQGAGITRGALYHHFDSKEALFEQAARGVAERTAGKIVAAVTSAEDPLSQLRACCHAYLDAGATPEVRQLLLRDAPAVLGWHAWRAMGTPESLGFFEVLLNAVIRGGSIRAIPVRPLAHALLGAINELNMSVADSTAPRKASQEAGLVLDRVIDGLMT